jgi:hypothetical protein
MTPSHPALTLYRDQLRDAIERDLGERSRHRPRGRLAFAFPTAGVAVAGAVATLVLTAGSAGGPSVADAAIFHHIEAALAPPAGTILHEQAMVSLAGAPAVPYELWAQADAPYAYRVIKFGHEGAFESSSSRPSDFAATLRAMVQSAQATIDATTTFDRVRAYKLTVTGSADRFLNGTAYVAASDYHPLELDTTGNGGEVIKFSAYGTCRRRRRT